MKIRLGFACISETINETTNTPYHYTDFKIDKNYIKLDDIIKSNLIALDHIIDYNIKNNIHFYRISSSLIPLATKDDVVFDYIDKYKDYYKKISLKIQKMRIDFHPNEYCILNSTRSEVIKKTIEILNYHYNLLEALNIKNKLILIHVGSSTFGKENSIKRFINSFNKLPNYLKKCLAIENDDKIFTIEDCIKISDILNIPIVLDYHHFNCNKSNLDLDKVIKSWKTKIPKMHFSSPKNKKEFRSHNDYINSDDFISFLNVLKKYNTDIDIMIEAKKKDEALFRLVRELKYKTDYKFIDETSFYI